MYYAHLRLPGHVTTAEKGDRCDALLRAVGLAEMTERLGIEAVWNASAGGHVIRVYRARCRLAGRWAQST